MLKRPGCSVEVAGDDAKAIDYFRQRSYKLVLMG